MERQYLILDADDTLWENNVYFERAFDEFIEYLNHSTLAPEEVRAVLDEIELINNKVHGYGSMNFGRNLSQCFERLVERNVNGDDLKTVMSFAERIMHHPIELIDGVKETVEYLCSRHDLTVFTKGHPEEQKLKIDRSGLSIYFGHTAVVKEKDSDSYSRLIQERKLPPERTWMIGNSPKSDINPALAVGLNAVFVPHERTWHLERAEIVNGAGKFLQVETFSDLRKHF